MTTIIWDSGYLYCDSQVRVLADTMQSLTKAQPLKEPTAFYSEKEDIVDVIYGYVVTGLMEAGTGFIKTLIKSGGDLETTKYLYDWAQRSQVVGESFTILMFGGKSNYLFSVDRFKVEFKASAFNVALGMGTGGNDTIAEIEKGSNVVRAMYKAFLINPNDNGGIIDMWRHEPATGHMFYRYGIINAVEEADLSSKITDMKAPVAVDLLSRQALDDLMPLMSAERLEKLNAEWAKRHLNEQDLLAGKKDKQILKEVAKLKGINPADLVKSSQAKVKEVEEKIDNRKKRFERRTNSLEKIFTR